jgi:3(or 17)beta-hydroxysteroid dehydrogenase
MNNMGVRQQMLRFADKVALVTGGASGLGRAVAVRLREEGASVVIGDIQPERGTAVAAEDGFTFVRQDVTDEAQWTATVASIEQRFGHLDILVNNAGILGSMAAISPENTPYEEWKCVLMTNGDSVFLGCRAAIPAMRRAGGGSIVNMSSIAALLATPYATAYGASKAVVRHLTKSVAQYCAQERLAIRCNSVHPGIVQAGMWLTNAAAGAATRGLSMPEVFAEAAGRVPLGDLTRAEDVAAAVAFLASDDARHITGEQLIVDGGFVHCDTYKPARAN